MRVIIRNSLIAFKDCLLFLALTSVIMTPFYLINSPDHELIPNHKREWKILAVLGIAEALACAILLYYRHSLSVFLKSIFKRSDNSRNIVLLGCFIGVISPILITTLLNISGHLKVVMLDKVNYYALLFFIPIWIFAWIEEVLFRYYLLKRLNYKSNSNSSIIISSILFAAFHCFNPDVSAVSFINIFLFGITMSLIYILSKENLLLTTTVHAFWNFISGIVMGGLVSGITFPKIYLKLNANKNDIISGGSFGIEGSLITTALFLILILMLNPHVKRVNNR